MPTAVAVGMKSDVTDADLAEVGAAIQIDDGIGIGGRVTFHLNGSKSGAGIRLHTAVGGDQNFQLAEGASCVDTAVVRDLAAAGEVHGQLTERDACFTGRKPGQGDEPAVFTEGTGTVKILTVHVTMALELGLAITVGIDALASVGDGERGLLGLLQGIHQQAQAKANVEAEAAKAGTDPHHTAIDGYTEFDGQYYREYRTFDISITKNVLALLIAAVLVTIMVMSVVRYYGRRGLKAPRKGMGFMEMLIDFVYTGVIKSTLGPEKGRKFAPYLLTCFFFILTMNLLGLIVIFPGGANLTGNIAVTMVLAVLTFVVTNINGSKHYWKEIFWPSSRVR